MGVDFRDVLNRGLQSLWVRAVEKETFPLFVNVGRGQFADKTAASGISMDTYEMSGWSNAIVDLDNDGRMAIGAKIRLTAADGSVQHNHVTTSTGYA